MTTALQQVVRRIVRTPLGAAAGPVGLITQAAGLRAAFKVQTLRVTSNHMGDKVSAVISAVTMTESPTERRA